MNVNNSFHLLSQLEQLVDNKKPIKPQLLHHFVPTLWGEGVHLRSSLLGRISSWLNENKSVSDKKSVVYKCFSKALHSLNADKNAKQISTNLRIHLAKELSSEWAQLFNDGQEVGGLKSPELNKLHQSILEENANKRKNLRKDSLFATMGSSGPILNAKQFEAIFNPATHEGEYLGYYQDFLSRHPEFKASDFKSKIDALKDAKEYDLKLVKAFPHELDQETRIHNISTAAAELSQKSKKQPVNSRWMFLGGYGNRGISINSLDKLLKALPTSMIDALPKGLNEIKDLPNPTKFVEEMISEVFASLEGIETPKSAKWIDIFFGSQQSNELSKNSQKYLHKGIVNHLLDVMPSNKNTEFLEFVALFPTQYSSTTIKLVKGIASLIMSVTPSPESRELMEWLVKYAPALTDSAKKTELINEFKEKALKFIRGHSVDIQNQLTEKIFEFISGIMTPELSGLLTLLGVEDFISSGEFWIEFETMPDKTITMQIYASGPALNMHLVKGKYAWPVKIEGINPDKLDEDFFYQIIRYHVEPRCTESKFTNSAAELFEGVIDSLGGLKFNLNTITKPITSKLDMVEEMLSKSGRLMPQFKMHCEALLFFCRPFYTEENGLTILDDQTASLLELAVKQLQQDFDQVESLLGKNEIEKVSLIFADIRKSVSDYRVSKIVLSPVSESTYQFSPEVIAQIKESLSKANISINHLKSAKRALVWALGDEEIGLFIDSLVEGLGPVEANKGIEEITRGWFKQYLSDSYIKMMLNVINLGLSIKEFASSPFSFMLVYPAVDWALKNGLIEPIYSWYVQVITTVKQKMAELFLKVILTVLMSEEQLIEFNQMAKDWQVSVNSWIKLVKGNQEIAFDIPLAVEKKPLAQVTLETELKVSIDDVMINKDWVNPSIAIDNLVTLKRETLLKDLSRVNEKAKNLTTRPEQKLNYILDQLKTFPIPSEAEKFWDNINKSELLDIMDNLSDLGVHLEEAISKEKRILEDKTYSILTADLYLKNLRHTDAVIEMHFILAVLDKLGRQSDEANLKDYKINAYGLINHLSTQESYLNDFHEAERLDKIFSYFFPELDINKLPSEEEVEVLAGGTLFNYSWMSNKIGFFSNIIGQKELIEIRENSRGEKMHISQEKFEGFSKYNIPELNYLKNRLQDLYMSKSVDPIVNSVHLSDEEKIGRLFESSLVLDNKLIPKAYGLVRLQSMLSQHVLRYNKVTTHAIKKYELTSLPEKPVQKVNSFWNRFRDKVVNQIVFRYQNDEADLFNKGFYHNFRVTTQLIQLLKQQKSQIQVIEDSIGVKLAYHISDLAFKDATLSKFINVEDKDRLVRMLAYFIEDRRRLLNNFEDDFILTRLKFIEFILFSPNRLRVQLIESPQFAQVVGEFFALHLEYYQNQIGGKHYYYPLLYFVHLGILARQYVIDFDPAAGKYFPDFQAILNNLGSKNDEFELLDLLKVSLLPSHDSLSLEEKRKTALFIGKVFYSASPKSVFKSKFTTHMYIDFSSNVNKIYLKWFPAVLELLKDPDFKQTYLDQVLEVKSIASPEKDLEWKKMNDFNFHRGGIAVSLLSPVIEKSAHSSFIASIKSQFSHLDVGVKDLLQVNDQLYETPNKQLKVILASKPSLAGILVESDVTFFKKIGGVDYRYIGEFNPQTIQYFKLNLPFVHSSACWVEETQGERRFLFVYDKGTFVAKGTYENSNIELFDLVVDETSSFEVALSSFSKALAPLRRFCPLENITCWGEQGQLLKFLINPFDLLFNVGTVDDKLVANSDLFSGYYIAPQQYYKSLNVFPSYLLLQNIQGQNKVIIPVESLVKSFAYGYLSALGPLTQYFGGLLPPALSSAEAGNSKQQVLYYQYEMGKNGQLTSNNPEAIAYILTQYLVQKDKVKALVACEQLESFCRLQNVSRDVDEILSPLLYVPSHFEGISEIRLKLYSALAENEYIHRPKVEVENTNPKEDLRVALKFVKMGILLKDLELLQKRREKYISDDQEWILAKDLIQQITVYAKDLIVKKMPFFSRHFDLIKLDEIGEMFGLTHVLKDRFRELQDKFEPLRGHSLLVDIWKAPSMPALEIVLDIPYMSLIPKSSISFSKILKAYNHADVQNISNMQLLIDVETTPNLDNSNKYDCLGKYFLSYYAIAAGNGLLEKKDQLSKFITLNRGGWNEQSRALIEYLRVVNEAPIFFPTIDSLIKDIGSLNYDALTSDDHFLRCLKLSKFFVNLKNYTAIYVIVRESLLPLIKNQVVSRVERMVIGEVPGLMIQSAGYAATIANLGGKVYHAASLRARQTLNLYPTAPKESEQEVLTILTDSDVKIDKFLDELFNKVFTVSTETTKHRFDPFIVTPQESNAIKDRLNRINESINDYYNRPIPISGLSLKDDDLIWTLYSSISVYHSQLKQQVNEEFAKLILIVKDLSEDATKSISIDQLKQCFIEGQYKSILGDTASSEVKQFDLIVTKTLLKATRVQQFERIIAILEDLSQSDPKIINEYESKWELLATELLARRAYEFKGIPGNLLRRFIAFEFSTTKMIWKKQVESMKGLLMGSKGNYVIELIMASGKTWFGIPFLNAVKATGEEVVFNIWTPGLAGTNTQQTAEQGKLSFNQLTNAIQFTRNKHLTIDYLSAVYAMMQRSIASKQTISATKEDLQSLGLLFVEKMYQYSVVKKDRSEMGKLVQSLQLIRRLILIKGKVIGDESHVLFNRKDELNYPLGASSTISTKYYDMIEGCFKALVKEEQFKQYLQKNSLKDFDQVFTNEVKERIATELLKSNNLKWIIDDLKPEFIAYVTGQTKSVPQWIKNSDYFSEISMIKGVLNTLLSVAFSRKFGVGYGRSHTNEREEFAKPYLGNEKPLEQSSIASHYEAVVKSMLLYLYTGLEEWQAQKLVGMLERKAKQQSERQAIIIEETNAYITLRSFSASKNLSEIQRNDDAILFYNRVVIKDQIKYWKLNLRQDAQNFNSMFAEQIYDTGTPYNDGSYPEGVSMLWDPGTIGEALHLIQERCPVNGVHVLSQSEPKRVLDEVLAVYFKTDLDFTALIDGGALLNGMSNHDVALDMHAYAARQRPDIEAIIFFMPDKNGVDQLVYLQKDSEEVLPFAQCKVPKEKCWSYFDEVHGFGADIPQKSNAKGLILFGKDEPLFKTTQEAFRMRGLGKVKRLKSDVEDNSVQRIEFALTKDTAVAISGDKKPSLKELLLFAIKTEAELVAEDNYYACLQKLNNIVYTAVTSKLLMLNTLSEMESLFNEFHHILISSKEDDPAKLYGLIDTEMSPLNVIESSKKKCFDLVNKSVHFTDNEKLIVRKKIDFLSLPVMPESVIVNVENSEIVVNGADLNRSVNISEVQEQESEVEQEQEQQKQKELQQDVEINLKNGFGIYRIFEEFEWPKLDPLSIDWLTMSNYKNPKKNQSEVPPLFSFIESLAVSDDLEFNKVAKAFDGRLWYSNNFIPRSVGFMQEVIEIGSQKQREVLEVLIQANMVNNDLQILSVGCLSQKDMLYWRNNLANVDQNSTRKVFLYDTKLRVIVAGSQVNLDLLRTNSTLMSLEVQLKFLNGEIIYLDNFTELLKKLILAGGAEDMKQVFQKINKQRKNLSLEGTIIDQIFDECI